MPRLPIGICLILAQIEQIEKPITPFGGADKDGAAFFV
jgi:hypothetical protein